MYFYPIAIEFPNRSNLSSFTEKTLTSHPILVLYIYIYTLIRYHAQIVTTYQIRVKAEVEDKSSVNKQNGVAASSSTVFRTVFFRRGGHISTRGNVKRRFQRAN